MGGAPPPPLDFASGGVEKRHFFRPSRSKSAGGCGGHPRPLPGERGARGVLSGGALDGCRTVASRRPGARRRPRSASPRQRGAARGPSRRQAPPGRREPSHRRRHGVPMRPSRPGTGGGGPPPLPDPPPQTGGPSRPATQERSWRPPAPRSRVHHATPAGADSPDWLTGPPGARGRGRPDTTPRCPCHPPRSGTRIFRAPAAGKVLAPALRGLDKVQGGGGVVFLRASEMAPKWPFLPPFGPSAQIAKNRN